MTQFSTQTEQFLNTNRNIYEVVYVANGANGDIVSTTNPLPVTSTVVTGATDAFGRQRVSEPFTLGDYKHLYGLDPNFIDYVENGATIAFQANQAAARLTTTSNPSSRAVHQTKFYHHYMPGKSQFILASFNFYDAVTNVTKRTGYFDDNNGIFLEQAGDGTLSFVVRSFVSGSPVDTRITQANWNGDKADGTGPEGWAIDITKTQLLWIDFQWLGVGAVRCGFVHDERYHLCHTFYHSDNLPTVYISSPNLPVRCEILNTGTTAGGYFDQICTTVVSEGGYVEAGQDWGVTSPSLRTLASGATLPVLCLRLKPTFKTYDNRMIVRLNDINIFTTGENIKYRVLKLPNQAALTGSTWVDVDTDSGVQYNATATAFGTFNEIQNGFAAAQTQGGRTTSQGSGKDIGPTAKKNYIVQNYDSTDSEIYAIVVTNIGGSSTTVGVGVQWREIY